MFKYAKTNQEHATKTIFPLNFRVWDSGLPKYDHKRVIFLGILPQRHHFHCFLKTQILDLFPIFLKHHLLLVSVPFPTIPCLYKNTDSTSYISLVKLCVAFTIFLGIKKVNSSLKCQLQDYQPQNYLTTVRQQISCQL